MIAVQRPEHLEALKRELLLLGICLSLPHDPIEELEASKQASKQVFNFGILNRPFFELCAHQRDAQPIVLGCCSSLN